MLAGRYSIANKCIRTMFRGAPVILLEMIRRLVTQTTQLGQTVRKYKSAMAR